MLKPLRKIHLSIIGVALLLSVAGLLLFYSHPGPYKAIPTRAPVPNIVYDKIFFHDLNCDNVGERIVIWNKSRLSEMRNIKIYHQGRGLINQWNLRDSLLVNFVTFWDVNKDGVQDLLAWQQNQDSLFLSILDIANARVWLDHQFILSSPGPFPTGIWDITQLFVTFTDSGSVPSKQMYFTISSGYSRRPRGIYLYDFQKQKILRHLPILATGIKLQAVRIPGAKPQILYSSYATDNFPEHVPFTDKYSWLALLSDNLDTLHTFHNKKAYSSIMAFPFVIHDSLNIITVSNLPHSRQVRLFNSRLALKKQLLLKVSNCYPYFSDTRQEFTLFTQTLNGLQRKSYDLNLNLIDALRVPRHKDLSLHEAESFVSGQELLFYYPSGNKLHFIDTDYKALMQIPINDSEIPLNVTYQKLPGQELPKMAVNTTANTYFYQIQRNPIFAWWPLLLLLIFLAITLVLFGIYQIYNKLRIFFVYFVFSLKKSDNAIILLNHKGRVISINHKVVKMLHLNGNSANGQSYRRLFASRPQLRGLVEQAMQSNKLIKEEISYEDAQNSFIGEIAITPFFSFYRFVQAWLIEIKDSTQQVLADRNSNWQRTVRKMVHDIKNPLGGVQLKLQGLYFKLNELDDAQASNMLQDLETANAELKRIHTISKEFLKFSDLDTPQFKPIIIRAFLQRVLQHFTAFQTEYLKINYQVHQDIPETIVLDERQIELLIHILVENAIDALNGKGRIEVVLGLAQKLSSKTEPMFQLEVIDNGPGISAEYQDKIFEPHFTSKKEGSGMGLVFAKQIVFQHNGQIEFYSQGGTSFIIRLPIKEISYAKSVSD